MGGPRNINNKGSELVYSDQDFTVERAILQGHMLRRQKRTLNIEPSNEGLRLKFIKPPPTKKNKGRRKNSKYKTPPRQSTSQYHCAKSRKPKTKRRKCPLRLLEIARPSKRHCLESWKARGSQLPPEMLERLKQEVLDQKPIINIEDAITCFQRHPAKKKRQSKKRIPKVGAKSRPNNDMYCALFTCQVAKHLLKTLRINLHPDSGLGKLSNVVGNDLSVLMSKKRLKEMKRLLQDPLHDEMSSKIAMWISSIMDETEIRIMEEAQLDLEEEIGPALDMVDEIFDSAMSLIKVDESVENESTLEEHMVDEINKIINGIVPPNSEAEDTEGESEGDGQGDTKKDRDSDRDGDRDDDNDGGSQIKDGDEKESQNDRENEQDSSDTHDQDATDEAGEPKVIDTIEELKDDEESDDKKVKFSDINLTEDVEKAVNVDDFRNLIEKNSHSGLTLHTSHSHQYTNDLNLDLNPMKKELISAADESWPSDTSSLHVNVGSVSKSIISLGDLKERAISEISELDEEEAKALLNKRKTEREGANEPMPIGDQEGIGDKVSGTTKSKIEESIVEVPTEVKDPKPELSKTKITKSQRSSRSSSLSRYKAKGFADKYHVLPVPLSQREIDIWCYELDVLYQNLDLWNNWLAVTCEIVIKLLHRGRNCRSKCRKMCSSWRKLRWSIDHDAKLWCDMNRRVQKRHREAIKSITSRKCNCNRFKPLK